MKNDFLQSRGGGVIINTEIYINLYATIFYFVNKLGHCWLKGCLPEWCVKKENNVYIILRNTNGHVCERETER